jgi:hypothetical protein
MLERNQAWDIEASVPTLRLSIAAGVTGPT